MEPVEEVNDQVQTLEKLGLSIANYNSIYMLDNEERLKKFLFLICLCQIVVNKLSEKLIFLFCQMKFSEYTSVKLLVFTYLIFILTTYNQPYTM